MATFLIIHTEERISIIIVSKTFPKKTVVFFMGFSLTKILHNRPHILDLIQIIHEGLLYIIHY